MEIEVGHLVSRNMGARKQDGVRDESELSGIWDRGVVPATGL